MHLKSGHFQEKSGLRALAIPLAMLTFVTVLAFANAWPNRLVFDDKAFAGPGRAAELESLQYIFTHDVWASVGTSVGLYRPLLLLQLSLETSVFGDWLEGYHLSNIFQHLLVTLLLFGFLRFLLRKTSNTYSTSNLCALLAALVFAVHPIHTEVVNSVFNRSDIMVALFGLGGLWWLLHNLDGHPGRAWSGLAVTYFLGMLSKENAVVIPGLAVVLILAVTPGELISRIRRSLPVLWMLLPLALYLVLRANALFPPELGNAIQTAGGEALPAVLDGDVRSDPAALVAVEEALPAVPDGDVSTDPAALAAVEEALPAVPDGDVSTDPAALAAGEEALPAVPDAEVSSDAAGLAARGEGFSQMLDQVSLARSTSFLSIAGIYGETLKFVVWPYPLQLEHSLPSTPILVGYAVLNLALILAAFVQVRRKRYGLATGLAFFYLTMLPAIRLISTGESGPHFAERYAYVPSIGLAIVLAVVLSALTQRFSPRVLAGVALPLVLVLTALTWDRNTDWRSEVSLFGTEYQRGNRGTHLLRWITGANIRARNYAWVVKICDENQAVQEYSSDSSFVESCATAYEQQHRYEEAERAHLYAIAHENTRIAASMSLARFYLRQGRPQDAEKRFMAAIDWSDDPADKAMNTVEMIIRLNPSSRKHGIIAKGLLEEALRLRPGWPKAEAMLQRVEQALNSSENPKSAVQLPDRP